MLLYHTLPECNLACKDPEDKTFEVCNVLFLPWICVAHEIS